MRTPPYALYIPPYAMKLRARCSISVEKRNGMTILKQTIKFPFAIDRLMQQQNFRLASTPNHSIHKGKMHQQLLGILKKRNLDISKRVINEGDK